MDNSRALDRFLESQERRAYKMAFYATGDREEALEIVQDAMFKLVEKYAHKSEADWGPLFTRIVQNRIKNSYRKRAMTQRWQQWFGANSEDKGDAEIRLPADTHSDPLRESHDSKFVTALEGALKALPTRQQQVFLLRAVQGMDVKQSAFAMSCSEGSIKTHYSRAIHKLKDQLGIFNL
ncbi:MAG: RNA polymerase sigma factor [Pseudomonadales bacterium]